MARKSHHTLSLIACLLFLTGKNAWAAGPTPEWVESGRHRSYPTSLFILGVGSAPNPSDAESNALSSIGKQIRSQVQTKAVSQVSSFGESVMSYFNQNVDVESTEAIEGAKFVERFKSSEELWSVLAVVKISDLIDQRRASAIGCYQTATKVGTGSTPVEAKISPSEILTGAVGLQIRSLECQKRSNDFRLVESLSAAKAAVGADASTELSKLEEALNSKLKSYTGSLRKLSFNSRCEWVVDLGAGSRAMDGNTHEVCDTFESLLVDFGLKKSSDKPSFELKIRFSAQDKKARATSLAFVKAKATVEFIDTTDSKVFFQDHAADEGAGASVESAVAKADKKISQKLKDSFLQKFRKAD